MKIIFFGSSDFSIPTFNAILNSKHDLIAVVTTPDRKSGRGLHLHSTVVKEAAEENGVKCFTPENLKDETFIKEIKELKPDLLVVASYGKFIPDNVLGIPKHSAINLHPSLLPKYRGAAPINFQIIDGQKEVGVSVFKVTDKLDSGDILGQESYEACPEDDAAVLSEKLSEKGAGLLMKVIEEIEKGQETYGPQNDDEASYAPLLKKENGRIDWNRPAREIKNLVLGMMPWPGAFTVFRKKRLKILGARVADLREGAGRPGEIIEVNKEGFLRIVTGEGQVLVTKVQLEGKSPLDAYRFAIGQRIVKGEVLG